MRLKPLALAVREACKQIGADYKWHLRMAVLIQTMKGGHCG